MPASSCTPEYARRASSSPRCPSHLHRSYARICSESELLSSDVERLGATANVRRHYEVLRRQLRTQSRGCARELGPGTCGCAASTQEGRRALLRSSRSRPTMVVQQAHVTKAKVQPSLFVLVILAWTERGHEVKVLTVGTQGVLGVNSRSGEGVPTA